MSNPKITFAALDIINHDYPENHQFKYRNNRLNFNNIDMGIEDIVYSWHKNFMRDVGSSEVSKYNFSQIYLEFDNGVTINYEQLSPTEIRRSVGFNDVTLAKDKKLKRYTIKQCEKLHKRIGHYFEFKK